MSGCQSATRLVKVGSGLVTLKESNRPTLVTTLQAEANGRRPREAPEKDENRDISMPGQQGAIESYVRINGGTLGASGEHNKQKAPQRCYDEAAWGKQVIKPDSASHTPLSDGRWHALNV